MGVMMRTDSDAAKLKKLTDELMARREARGSTSSRTRSIRRVMRARRWTEADKFEEKRKVFFDATDTLARVVETPDEASARRAYADVEASCKSCHKAFKYR